MSEKITISGTGCCLVDFIYHDIDFNSLIIMQYRSSARGDGGLHPGRLVFKDKLEQKSGKILDEILAEIAGAESEPFQNIGGPSVVSLIHTSQLVFEIDTHVNFYGICGRDKAGKFLMESLNKTPLRTIGLRSTTQGATPSTHVLSDPSYNSNKGERIFINDIGAAADYEPACLEENFFNSDIVIFGGTALVPKIHRGLFDLLKKARQKGCMTIVNTVYDFLSDLEAPGEKWKLGKSSESYALIDLLIMDLEEAQNLSMKKNVNEVVDFFIEQGSSALIITRGTLSTIVYSDGSLFMVPERREFPVSERIVKELSGHTKGDTTGCGDNFAGGVLASIATQLYCENTKLNLQEAVSWGTVSGGYCCFNLGGTIIEKSPGEKLQNLRPYYRSYLEQMDSVKSILIFGAGKIGRSFIGQLFSKASYDVIFVDMDKVLVDELNKRKGYPVVILTEEEESTINVENVSAIHGSESDRLTKAIREADIIAVSVGKNAIKAVARSLTEGLLDREAKFPGRTLDIILAENSRNAGEDFLEELSFSLPPGYPLKHRIGIVETSIGKMVPIMTLQEIQEDPLRVFAEAYNTLILDKNGFKGSIPLIPELSLKKDMKAWVDRKAFIHNLGHASAAYAGYVKYPEAIYMYEILADEAILNFTRSVMQNSAKILLATYPEAFSWNDLVLHIEDLLNRFQNKKLRDTIFRVGCDLKRKLSANDRFMGVIYLAKSKNLSYKLILKAMSNGFLFKAEDESGKMFPGDIDFHIEWNNDPDRVLVDHCGVFDQKDRELLKTRC